jgi:leader peptidase (prepilin peptidase)/N-methyltransferase
MEELFAHPLRPIIILLVGACIGSFLNVVIYRVPLGLGVSDPKRSFCPHCKKDIPWYRNLPCLTWLLQRAKCAECGAPIAFRYFFVEFLTMALFGAAWYLLSHPFPGAFFIMALCVLLVVISFIDAEHMIIPVNWCYAGMAIGAVGGVLAPALFFYDGRMDPIPNWWGGGQALIGVAVGWGVLAAVVILGKVCFGERKMKFDEAEKWYLREPENDEEELQYVVGDEHIGWSDLFYRKNDRIEIAGHGVLLDGKRTKATNIVIRANRVELDGNVHMIEKISSLEGKADLVRIPREAMGGGDPPLMGMIGAFVGWPGVIFTLFASCIYALVAAVLGRVGFGRPLPFGPFLALGGLTWIFGGWKLWEMYFSWVETLQF